MSDYFYHLTNRTNLRIYINFCDMLWQNRHCSNWKQNASLVHVFLLYCCTKFIIRRLNAQSVATVLSHDGSTYQGDVISSICFVEQQESQRGMWSTFFRHLDHMYKYFVRSDLKVPRLTNTKVHSSFLKLPKHTCSSNKVKCYMFTYAHT